MEGSRRAMSFLYQAVHSSADGSGYIVLAYAGKLLAGGSLVLTINTSGSIVQMNGTERRQARER